MEYTNARQRMAENVGSVECNNEEEEDTGECTTRVNIVLWGNNQYHNKTQK